MPDATPTARADLLTIWRHMRTSMRETFHYRASEWALACIIMLWAMTLWSAPELFASVATYSSMTHMIPQEWWAIGMAVAGGGRLVALAINGAWHRTPHLRALGAFVSCFFWLEISFGLWHTGTPTTGLAVYPVLLLLDSYNVLRAAGDARHADEHHKQVSRKHAN